MAGPVRDVIDRLEAFGCRPRQAGDRQWKAHCPAHDDQSPSLSVTEGDDGRVLLHCHASCEVDAVLSVLDLKAGDLFAARSNGDGQPETITAYDYVDENGALLFQVVRRFPKRFLQRRPAQPGDPDAKQERDGRWWIWKLGDTRRVLYNLPDVVGAIRHHVPVYVVEGEKDAEALGRAGYVATTNPGGAGKWRSEHAEVLRGAEVVVVADRDTPGRAHAAAVASSVQGVADRVQVVEAKAGKDVTDHLAAGHAVEDLLPVRTGSPDREDDQATPGASVAAFEASVIDWPTFWAEEGATEDWLAEPVLPAGRQVAIFATAKTGKSLLALEVAAAKATGRAVLDQPAGPPVRVLYLDYEQSADDLRDRLSDLGYGPETDLSNLVYALLPTLPPLDTVAGGDAVAAMVSTYQPALVVVDTMARAIDGEENSADTLRAFYRYTGSRLKALGVALLRLDHAGKDASRGQRGTSSKAEDVDVVWKLTAEGKRVELRRTHSRVPWVPDHVVLTREDEPHLVHRSALPNAWPAGTAEVATDLEELGVPLDATVKTALTALKKADRGRRRQVVASALKYRRGRS